MISVLLVYFVAFLGIAKKQSKPVTFLLIIISFIMAWLSNDQYDYLNYEFAYNSLKSTMALRFEFGYQLLMKLGNLVGLDYSTFRAIYSAIAILIIYYAMRYYTDNINIVFGLGMVFPLIYLFPIQRFLMGAAIIFFSFRYLIKETPADVAKYLIGVIIAGLLHSGCFFFLVLPIYILFKKNYRPSTFFFAAICSVIPLIFLAKSEILSRLISTLPLGRSVLTVLTTGNRANINGIIEETVITFLVIAPGLLSVYYYAKGNSNKKTDKMSKFMNFVFYLNVMALYVIVIRVYSQTATRILYIVIMINYAAAGNALMLYSQNVRNYSKQALVVMSGVVGCTIAVLCLQLFYSAPHLKDVVFWMHFTTNPVFAAFNSLMGG